MTACSESSESIASSRRRSSGCVTVLMCRVTTRCAAARVKTSAWLLLPITSTTGAICPVSPAIIRASAVVPAPEANTARRLDRTGKRLRKDGTAAAAATPAHPTRCHRHDRLSSSRLWGRSASTVAKRLTPSRHPCGTTRPISHTRTCKTGTMRRPGRYMCSFVRHPRLDSFAS